MKIKGKNLRRFASLSALGAGAFGAAGGTAAASSIVYSGILDEHVGVSKGFQDPISFVGPGGAGGILRFSSNCICSGTCFSCRLFRSVVFGNKNGVHGTALRFLASSRGGLQPEARGAKWKQQFEGKSATQAAAVAGWYFSFSHSKSGDYTNFTSQDRYILFRFADGALPKDLYGWVDLRVRFAEKGHSGPDVTLVSWAYDTSGAEIRAGETGAGAPFPAETPEPSTFALTGLAALALGAKGVRSWRAARRKAGETC